MYVERARASLRKTSRVLLTNYFAIENELTSKCDVIFRLSKGAFWGLGTSLIRIAHKYKEGDIYLNSYTEPNRELVFYLTNESPLIEIRCKKFESAFCYDNNVI